MKLDFSSGSNFLGTLIAQFFCFGMAIWMATYFTEHYLAVPFCIYWASRTIDLEK